MKRLGCAGLVLALAVGVADTGAVPAAGGGVLMRGRRCRRR